MEYTRLSKPHSDRKWKVWGPYLSERQWGTVREDYSPNGNTWSYINHDLARSYAYRWGEDGIAGFCDIEQVLCLAPVFWNGKDTILKERLFGLTNQEGNHGEDVKELYFHLDSSPTHAYCKYLYKYPQVAFPYMELLQKNQKDRLSPEFEILDTTAFNDNRYFDCVVEYAKAGTQDILMKITVHNRGPEAAAIHVLPHLWFRNFWRHNPRYTSPQITSLSGNCLQTYSIRNGSYYFYHEDGEQLFCENETNSERIFHKPNVTPFVKDGINDYVVNRQDTINPKKTGTKAAIWLQADVPPGASKTFKVRLSTGQLEDPWTDFDGIFETRLAETDSYYKKIAPAALSKKQKGLLRSTLSGLLWGKQFYYFDVYKWLFGEPHEKQLPRNFQRNYDWQHLTCRNIISMPDKWEYPWFAAWDLAFHAATFVHIDPEFAKQQLLVILREYYMHPNGQIPAYEWNFSDVNPPVHAWSVWYVYEADKKKTGVSDWDFLERSFQKLLMNFTWWVNQKDANGTDIFEGGFLGLDNIGVFDRNYMPPGIKKLQQADATSWMAMYAINMLRISLELAQHNLAYEESAAKFFRHFLNIGWAMHHVGKREMSLWDEEDAFYYDAIQFENGASERLKVRSLVGIIPLLAVEIMNIDLFKKLTEFNARLGSIKRTRPDLTKVISDIEKKNKDGNYLFAIMVGDRLEHLLKRLLDEDEFLSDYGIRSLSKCYQDKPFVFGYKGSEYSIRYEPGESSSSMFGGNSNWRGPIWLPINYLIINSLRKYYEYYGDDYTYEFPARSGNKLTLKQIANELTKRLLTIFEKNEEGAYQYHSSTQEQWTDEHFKEHHLFYEFFNGDTGQGLGASHQTGWTALIANLLLEMDEG
ncbi:MGH1-like glycoside hydrolase domain-containing protein [Mucilaginibacter sp.]|uniref:MGH1-like glycoside hydrolase domain-containing protein n=1 Tax=Mucilaginibacter sp. TaxID=1882438 RepID=UPI00283D8FE6|nr:glucosidase [Mucilaginibacter sp.]MDR3693765.1 glucosidase [Mucilaginibacter sp.]